MKREIYEVSLLDLDGPDRQRVFHKSPPIGIPTAAVRTAPQARSAPTPFPNERPLEISSDRSWGSWLGLGFFLVMAFSLVP